MMRMIAAVAAGFVLSVSSMTCAASDETWQRVEVLGHSADGTKLLIFRSHFGPSSRAPSGSLEILGAGEYKPELTDGLSAFVGDESTIALFKTTLLERHQADIEKAGIEMKPVAFADAVSISTENVTLRRRHV